MGKLIKQILDYLTGLNALMQIFIVLAGVATTHFLGFLEFLKDLTQGEQINILLAVFIFGHFFSLLNYTGVKNKLENLIRDLIDKKVIEAYYTKKVSYTENSSPKKLTPEARKMLKKHNVDKFILTSGVLGKNFRDMEEYKVLGECLYWVKEKGQDQIKELTYNNDISERESEVVLALAIHEKILMPVKLCEVVKEEELEFGSNREYESYKKLFNLCDIEMSNYVYEVINKLEYFITRFNRLRSCIYRKRDGKFIEGSHVKKHHTFKSVLFRDYNLLVAFF